MMRQYELVERVKSYEPDVDEALLNKAYVFSLKAHGTQTRASGDPYFSHPVEVAGILTDLKLDTATIATALLHDTIEDTVATSEEVHKVFGQEVGFLVDGVTKLSKLEIKDAESAQAENFRKFVLALSDDIRVLLVKLADRLHNMRTLHFVKPHKQVRISQETMDIYAPLAGRIGMQAVREELEDISFTYLNPDARNSIIARLTSIREQGEDLVQGILDSLKARLAENGIDAYVYGREKRPYSIWKKMQAQKISFEQLSDVIAFRVIASDEDECYRILGVIHRTWPSVPDRFKDYISTPKQNGYRSVHTTVIGPKGQRVEVQIRTKDMHEVAEQGVAAHWHYKEGGKLRNKSQSYEMLHDLMHLLEISDSSEEFLEHTKLQMFHDQVFCFTPKGRLIGLPRGATPIDFAYAVHTDVGNTCVGCRINGHPKPLRTELSNGDEVHILRSDAQRPQEEWEDMVVTGRARSAIRRSIRMHKRDEYIKLGRDIAVRAFETDGHNYADRSIEAALKRLKFDTVDDVLEALGSGDLSSHDLMEGIFPGKRTLEVRRASNDKDVDHSSIPIRGLSRGAAVHFAECCCPLPGDRIVGIRSAGQGIMIHAIDCDMLEQFNDVPDAWLDVAWEGNAGGKQTYIGRLTVTTENRPGSLSAIASVIAEIEGNITNLHFENRSLDFYELSIDIEVEDLRHLTNIIAALRATPVVAAAERTRL